MIEIALFTGLGILGYVLAQQDQKGKVTNPKETFISYSYQDILDDTVTQSQEQAGHNNMVPYFGSKVTQSLSPDANQSVLDNHTGGGTHHFQKREERSFFDITPGITNSPFGNPNESEFLQSRQVAGMKMNNVFPIEKMLVGPGVDDGYTNLPSGGYNQDRARDVTMPKTTDELRTANKPKISYTADPTPGAFYVTQPGLQAPVAKNRPDRFGVLMNEGGELMHLNTAVGAQVAPAAFPEQVMKIQNRETTSRPEYGTATNAQGGALSYIRSFTEPFERFMKLTVGEHFGTGGGGVNEGTYLVDPYLAAYTNPNREAISSVEWTPGGSLPFGANPAGEDYHTQVKKTTEPLLEKAARFNTGGMNVVSSAENIGTVRNEQEPVFDIAATRNSPDILDAFRNNPYTHSLSSVA